MSRQALKYGENPQQQAWIASDDGSQDLLAIGKFTDPHGQPAFTGARDMSWSSIRDLDAGIEAITRIAAAFDVNVGSVPTIAVLVTHSCPFSAAVGSSDQVINKAIQSNFRAAFGSFLVTNVALSEPVAYKVRQWMGPDRPFEGIAAPSVDPDVIPYFVRKKGKTHLLANPALASLHRDNVQLEPVSRTVRGATLSQEPNPFVPKFPEDWDDQLKRDMCLAWGICAASASNCITIANEGLLVANASGQPERAAASDLAIIQARAAKRSNMLKGAAVVSDSYFSFADALDQLARRKVKAIFATSGSLHDEEVKAHVAQFDVMFHTVPDADGRIFFGH
ncbi:putative IMP cyclohydrolase [Candidatus Filomicrobium marinum]|uniref:Putative IMP cyclohydrolase n=1 Tax=Candidatus Filomicrobium marinum TaxID=1608628 RepID=A0A0D6JA58_9HYPH|nr:MULTISPECIES: hypothetical protein [Filomicrobium]MCV0368603.1 hypothetical protein [Filomicrobium sp.]CFX01082.1 putative IMP cyclohydrolase [Candidatus Filomicrobium marinum]CPR15381.1 putative IMP cyclohydrolase [Candidatus Filomicrobium marinum]